MLCHPDNIVHSIYSSILQVSKFTSSRLRLFGIHALDLVLLVLGRVALDVTPLLVLGVLAREHLAVVELAPRFTVTVALHGRGRTVVAVQTGADAVSQLSQLSVV